MQNIKKLIIVLAIGAVTFFVGNNIILPDIMESRNIVTAREMLSEGNYLVPTMNGVLRLEKPPLPTWIAAGVEWISPNNIALQRSAAGLAAMLLLFYFYKFADKVLKINPIVSSLIFLTCYNVILAGRTATWDIYCHAFMMGGIYHFIRAVTCGVSRYWLHFSIAGIYMGLSFLSKGPVALYALFLPLLICYLWFFKISIKGKWSGVFGMAGVFMIVGLWWYIYVHFAITGLFTKAITGEAANWINYNVRPWYYYWKFFLEAGVWALLLITAIVFPIFDREKRRDKNYLFSLMWLLIAIVLLSIMPEKKNRYLFPILIPASYLMGILVVLWKEKFCKAVTCCKSDIYVFRMNTFALFAVVLLIPIAGWIFLYEKGYISLSQWIMIILVCLFLAGYLYKAAMRLKPLGLVVGVTLLFLLAESFLLPALRNVINNPDINSIAKVSKIEELNGIPFYYKEDDELRIEIVYAARRKILPLSLPKDIREADSLLLKIPCALVTHQKIDELLLPEILNRLNIKWIGRFDDNHRPKGSRRYSEDFIYNVTLIEKK